MWKKIVFNLFFSTLSTEHLSFIFSKEVLHRHPNLIPRFQFEIWLSTLIPLGTDLLNSRKIADKTPPRTLKFHSQGEFNITISCSSNISIVIVYIYLATEWELKNVEGNIKTNCSINLKKKKRKRKTKQFQFLTNRTRFHFLLTGFTEILAYLLGNGTFTFLYKLNTCIFSRDRFKSRMA